MQAYTRGDGYKYDEIVAQQAVTVQGYGVRRANYECICEAREHSEKGNLTMARASYVGQAVAW